jgi:tetrahydromethanopterin S-methyltransferase subunit G
VHYFGPDSLRYILYGIALGLILCAFLLRWTYGKKVSL